MSPCVSMCVGSDSGAQLQELDLRGCVQVRAATVALLLRRCPQLSRVALHHSHCAGDVLETLAACCGPHLHRLSFRGLHCDSDAVAELLLRLPLLESLEIDALSTPVAAADSCVHGASAATTIAELGPL